MWLTWMKPRAWIHFAARSVLTYGFFAYLGSTIIPFIYGALSEQLRRGFKGILRCFSLLQLFCKINDGESPVGLGSTLYILLSTTDPPCLSPENYITPQTSTNSFPPPPDTYDWPEWSHARRTHVAARSVPYIWVLRLPKQHHQPFPFIVHWVSNWGESSRAFWSVFVN